MSKRIHFTVTLGLICLVIAGHKLQAQDFSDAELRLHQAQEFHRRAMQRTGILIPMYLYPSDIHTNPTFNRLMELKRRCETVPMWIIVNPASGPGEKVDANFTKAIDRLCGAGCVVLGYVATNYAKRPQKEVQADIDQWRNLYPRTQGIFFDEMTYEDTDVAVAYQASVNRYAKDAGYWPTVANPGTGAPERYFAANSADVIVIHEGNEWPSEQQLRGDYFGGNSDYPPFTRAVLVYGQASLNVEKLRMVRQYARWVYVTEDPFQVGNPDAPNPWDVLSRHMEAMCEELAR